MARDSKHIQQKRQQGTPVSLPSIGTALTADNLEEMIDEMFFNAGWINNLMTSISYNSSTGVISVIWNDSAFTVQTVAINLNPFNTDNLTEGASNLYYTNARTRGAISVTTGAAAYNSSTGVITIPGTTDHVTEGSNLFYTNERVDDRVSALIQNGTGISWSYNDAGGTLTPTISLSPFSTSNLSEGSNLYYTNTRARAAISHTTGSANYNSSTGVITIPSTTSHISEGSNLYYTDERVDDRVSTLVQNGTGISWNYNDVAGTLTPTISLSPFTTSNLSEGSNLYYTDTRARASISHTTGAANYNNSTGVITIPSTTSHISEGSNLYYTDERVDDRVAVLIQNGGGITWTYDDVANTLTPSYSASALTSDDIAEGSTNLYYTDTRSRNAISVSGSLSYDNLTGIISYTERTDTAIRALFSASGSLSYNSSTGVISYTERSDATIRGLFSASGDLSYNSSTGVFSITLDGNDDNYVDGASFASNILTLTRTGVLADLTVDLSSLAVGSYGLSTNYIPFYNGTSFADSVIYQDPTTRWVNILAGASTYTGTITESSIMTSNACTLNLTSIGTISRSSIIASQSCTINSSTIGSGEKVLILGSNNSSVTNVPNVTLINTNSLSVTSSTYQYHTIVDKLTIANIDAGASTGKTLLVYDTTTLKVHNSGLAIDNFVTYNDGNATVADAAALRSNAPTGGFDPYYVRCIVINTNWASSNPKTIDIATYLDEDTYFGTNSFIGVDIATYAGGTGGDNKWHGDLDSGTGDVITWDYDPATGTQGTLYVTRYGVYLGADYDAEDLTITIWYWERTVST